MADEVKLSGLIFDRKLTFTPHTQYLKHRRFKAFILLRVEAHTDWDADSSTLLRLYQWHVRLKLDYGGIAFKVRRALRFCRLRSACRMLLCAYASGHTGYCL